MNRIATSTASILLIFIQFTSSAQSLLTKEYLCDTCEYKLNFRFESTAFMKNNEYTSQYAIGKTGIGFQVKPTLEYYFNKNTKLNIGIYALKYSGLDVFSQAIPIFSVHHEIAKGHEFIFGNIYGNLNHELAEPLFRFDRYYTNNIEYGFQYLHNSKYIESDLWLNWEKFIFSGDPFQEEFTVGNHSKIKFIDKSKFKIYGDFQATLSHKGGEIDTYDGPSIYLFSGAYGLNIDFESKNFKYGASHKTFWYRGARLPEEGKNYQHFNHGNGTYITSYVTHKFFKAEAGYWQGEKFIASRGEYLFMNVSEQKEDLKENTRKIFTAKLKLKRPITKNLRLELRTEIYIDLDKPDLPDYTYGFYFVANELFFLKKLRK
jgi:hypothetical protein